MTAETITLGTLADLDDLMESALRTVRNLREECELGTVSPAEAAATVNEMVEKLNALAQ